MTAFIILVVIIVIVLLVRGGGERAFGELRTTLGNLDDCDRDAAGNFVDACPCDPAKQEKMEDEQCGAASAEARQHCPTRCSITD